MKKRILSILIPAVLSLSLFACAGKNEPREEPPFVDPSYEEPAEQNEPEEPMVGMANPWVDITEAEADEKIPNGFSAPKGATDIHWSMMTNDENPLIQLIFTLDGKDFCAREQINGDGQIVDISGVYAEWDVTDDITLANWGGGNMAGKVMVSKTEEETYQVCLWYDIEVGIAYSLSVDAPDLDGFDIQAIAEALYDPNKQASASIPDDDDVSGSDESSLPAYEYPGPEEFYYMLYKYITDEYADDYPKAQVGIPNVIIAAMDESDPEDIRVYGDFWYLNYDLNGDVLENVAGGSYPGCIHLKMTENGYEVTGMDVTEDGSGFDESAKKIFGDHYDDFMKIQSDQDEREKVRAQIIANYVAANNLNITAYKDYGHDAVLLPDENIDSFYSTLD